MSQSSARSLRQEELDGYHRHEFVVNALFHLNPNGRVRFLAVGRHHSLIEIAARQPGEWTISWGDQHRFTYRWSDVIHFLEQVYDSGAEVVALKGEAPIRNPQHVTANPDAEPDTTPLPAAMCAFDVYYKRGELEFNGVFLVPNADEARWHVEVELGAEVVSVTPVTARRRYMYEGVGKITRGHLFAREEK